MIALLSSSFVVLILFVLIVLFLHFVPLGLWVSALAAGVNVGIFTLVGMRLRRVVPSKIVLPLVKANKAGLDVNVDQLEAHYLAGGDVDRVVDALIAAERAAIPLTFERAAAIDLAGRDVLEAVQMSVNPKVIETPLISAVAKNGIELKVRARVTVRANIDRLVGGAGESTIIARVGEGIVTTVGSSEEHTDVLENPDHISRTVLSKGLDAGSAFEILSIDIADVDVGRNIGAQLMTDQAEADKNIAQAKAEERRAMAVAKEQEMRAYTQEMKAKVVEAQAEVPAALASALREGHLGVMDYYRMKNINADTAMREQIAGGEPCREWIIQVKSKEAAAWIISFSLSSSLLSFFQCTPHCAKKRPVLKEKRPLRIRPKKRPHEAPAPCDGAAAVLAESKDRGPLKESLEELKPSVQLVSNQEDLRKAQKPSRQRIGATAGSRNCGKAFCGVSF